jgi:coenzyme F420-dependent glucose-6-phosphate dehydrogenase
MGYCIGNRVAMATFPLRGSVARVRSEELGGDRLALTLGYKASAEQFGPRELIDFAVLAERSGFDSVVVSDHFQPWRHTDGHAPFSFAWLAAVGERTEHILLGTSVVTPTFRYHPAIVAQAMATIGCLNPGRLLPGVGTGESMNEVPVLGIEWPDPPERFARLKEAIELIGRLWREDLVTHTGQYYGTRNLTVYDRPVEPVRLFVAASRPAAARLAGRVADGFICTSGKGMELYADTLLPAVRDGTEKAGRSYDDVEKMIEMKVSFDTDRARALEDTARAGYVIPAAVGICRRTRRPGRASRVTRPSETMRCPRRNVWRGQPVTSRPS